MLNQVSNDHHVNPAVLVAVVGLITLHACILFAGVALLALGQPALLLADLAASAVIFPFLKLPVALLGLAQAFDRRRARLADAR